MSKLVALLSAHSTEVIVFFAFLSLVLIVKKVGVGKFLWGLFQVALVVFIVVALVVTFYRADHMPNPDTAFLKTLGFWGACVASYICFGIMWAILRIKSPGPTVLLHATWVLVCCIIYGLMF